MWIILGTILSSCESLRKPIFFDPTLRSDQSPACPGLLKGPCQGKPLVLVQEEANVAFHKNQDTN